jgi:hypothetical protein
MRAYRFSSSADEGEEDVEAAVLIVTLVKIYATIGAVVAAIFLCFGIDRVDDGAHGAYAFRPLLAPGMIVLWPLALWRWPALERHRP